MSCSQALGTVGLGYNTAISDGDILTGDILACYQ